MDPTTLSRLLRCPVRPTTFIFIVAFYLVLTQNQTFWAMAMEGQPQAGDLSSCAFLVRLHLIVVAALTAVLALICLPGLVRPTLTVLVLVAAVCSHFMDSYGVVIDEQMIVNAGQTDRHEAGDLLTLPFAMHLLIYGLIPAALIQFPRLARLGWRRALAERLALIAVAIVTVVGCVALDFKQVSIWARQHRDARVYLNPSYPIRSAYRLAKSSLGVSSQTRLQVIAPDANRPPASFAEKPLLVVLVVGETARAANFSLLGYGRPTNPELAEVSGVVAYPQASSCGTSTAYSVPCMFSALGKAGFSRAKAKAQENVLDVVHRVGVEVLWEDNNAGCKGVCARVPSEERFRETREPLCRDGECLDEILLTDFENGRFFDGRDRLVVLHQMGSHGPAYARRHPSGFAPFQPECQLDNVQACSREQIVNAYDNTIAYTDHVLASLIKRLQARSRDADVMLLYVSDHGESLGERGLYLHGLPEALAPREQTHVPLLVWMPPATQQALHVDAECLKTASVRAVSHDNLFSTLLGLFRIETRIYQPALDLFDGCRTR